MRAIVPVPLMVIILCSLIMIGLPNSLTNIVTPSCITSFQVKFGCEWHNGSRFNDYSNGVAISWLVTSLFVMVFVTPSFMAVPTYLGSVIAKREVMSTQIFCTQS